MNSLQLFENPEFGKIRTYAEPDGKVLFCGSDVAKALGYAKPHDAISTHCRYTVKRSIPHPQSQNKTMDVLFIPEGDIYRLAAKSELPGADKFESWIFDEVLPAIRTSGKYETPKVKQRSLGEVNSAARIITQTLKEAGMSPQFRAVAIKSLYAPVGVEIPLEGITLGKRLYDCTAMAKVLGLYSKSGYPHGQAVSAVIAQVDVAGDEKELAPFQNPVNGHSGTNWQYTESVLQKVSDWLDRHGYPAEIRYSGKSYKIAYQKTA